MDPTWRFGQGIRFAALLCGLYSLLAYITAFIIQLWWILRGEGSQPLAVYILASGFGLLVILSSVMIVGVALMQAKLYIMWLAFMLVWYAPELSLSLFVAIGVRSANTVQGAGELAFTCIRSSLNVLAMLIVHRLYKRETTRARVKRLLLATNSYNTSSLVATTIANGDNGNHTRHAEECSNSSVLKPSVGSNSDGLHTQNSQQETESVKKLTNNSPTLQLTPPVITVGSSSNELYDELHHISEEEDEECPSNDSLTSSCESPNNRDIISSGTSLTTMHSRDPQIHDDRKSTSKGSFEDFQIIQKQFFDEEKQRFNKKSDFCITENDNKKCCLKEYEECTEILTTNLDDTTTDDEVKSSNLRLSQVAINETRRVVDSTTTATTNLPSLLLSREQINFGVSPSSSSQEYGKISHNNKKSTANFVPENDDDNDEFMRQWNCNFFARSTGARDNSAIPAPAAAAFVDEMYISRTNSQQQNAPNANTTGTNLSHNNNARMYNELFAYRPKAIRHTPQMQDIAQMKRRPSVHERALSDKENSNCVRKLSTQHHDFSCATCPNDTCYGVLFTGIATADPLLSNTSSNFERLRHFRKPSSTSLPVSDEKGSTTDSHNEPCWDRYDVRVDKNDSIVLVSDAKKQGKEKSTSMSSLKAKGHLPNTEDRNCAKAGSCRRTKVPKEFLL